MDNETQKAITTFFDMYCTNAYIINRESCVNIKTNEVISLGSLIKKYSDGQYKEFYYKELSDFFKNIDNNSSIEFTTIINCKPKIVRLYIVHVDGIVYMYETTKGAQIDSLTHSFNNNEYEIDIKRLSKQSGDTNLVVLSFDLNDLKIKNDRLGHLAGNEYIKITAECISNAFALNGKCYRVGGDEFVVICHLTKEQLKECTDYFDYLTARVIVCGNKGISVSYGCASQIDYPEENIYGLREISDKRSYEQKREYHNKVYSINNKQNML